MKRILRRVAEPIAWCGIGLQFVMIFVFLRYTVIVPPSELRLTLGALTMSFIAIAGTNMYNLTQTKKLDKIEKKQDVILHKLDETRQQNEHTLFGEALATIVDNLIQRKTGGNK